MKIIRNLRDGRQVKFLEDTIKATTIEIELTDAEIEQAYREGRRYYNRCDLIHKIKQYMDDDDWEEKIECDDDDEFEIGNRIVTGKKLKAKVADEEFMRDLVESFEEGLNNHDSYWECYWLTAEAVIEDAFEEEE